MDNKSFEKHIKASTKKRFETLTLEQQAKATALKVFVSEHLKFPKEIKEKVTKPLLGGYSEVINPELIDEEGVYTYETIRKIPLSPETMKENIQELKKVLKMFYKTDKKGKSTPDLDDFKKTLKTIKFTKDERFEPFALFIQQLKNYFIKAESYVTMVDKIVSGEQGYLLATAFAEFKPTDIKKVERSITFKGPMAIGFKSEKVRKAYYKALRDPMVQTPTITHTLKIQDTVVSKFIQMNNFALQECFATQDFKQTKLKKKRETAVFWDFKKARIPEKYISAFYGFLRGYSWKDKGTNDTELSGYKGKNEAQREIRAAKNRLTRMTKGVIKVLKLSKRGKNGWKAETETVNAEVDLSHLLNEFNLANKKQLVESKGEMDIFLETVKMKQFEELRLEPKNDIEMKVRSYLIKEFIKVYKKACRERKKALRV